MTDIIDKTLSLDVNADAINDEFAALALFVASKGAASGLCELDADSKIPANRLPPLAINDTFTAASQVAMLALTAQRGDVALRSDTNSVFILFGDDPSDIDDWAEWLYPTSLYVLQTEVTATPTASKVPRATAGGKLDGWITDAASGAKGLIQLTGQLGGTAASPTVVGIQETGGPTGLTLGAVTDYQLLRRSGTNLVGVDPIRAITFTFDNAPSAIVAGTIAAVYVPYACTILEWTIGSVDGTSGSIVIDLWVDSHANFPPTVADTITASAKPTVSTATTGQSSTLTGWTTSVTAGRWIFAKVDSCTSIKTAVLALKVRI